MPEGLLQIVAVSLTCAHQALLTFLLDYPLSKKRLVKHINFLLANLEYCYETGRTAALAMLESVVLRFPDSVVQDHAMLIFVPIVAALINVEGTKGRETACQIIKALASRVHGETRNAITKLTLKWLREDSGARRSAIQVPQWLTSL